MKKYTIITGAGDGLGKRLALELAEKKKNLIIISRGNNLNKTYNILSKHDIECIKIQCDISNFKKINCELEKIIYKNFTHVDLVLCAGTIGLPGGILNSDLEDWSHTYNVNVLGNINILKFFLNNTHLVTKSIFIAGGGSAYGYPELFGYSISKTALVRAIENIYLEMKKINVNHITHIISPGAMKTKMLEIVKNTGAEIKTTVPIHETITIIIKLLDQDYYHLNGKFFHVRDDLNKSFSNKEKWLLRRIQ